MTRFCLIVLIVLLVACAPAATPPADAGSLQVLATNSVLADIAQNVAGDRLVIDSLIPVGIDPHAFSPTPRDAARIESTQILIVNGAGFEETLASILAGYQGTVITASAGLTSPTEPPDPHFWLDPTLAAHYVENIRDGLSAADPEGSAIYSRNAAAYMEQIAELDQWIETQVQALAPERRKLVTNHESFGYFAKRYGFEVVGTVLPGSSTSAAPSAQSMAALIDTIREQNVPAIFLETGAQPLLAEQIAAETGVKVISDLHTHSLGAPGSEAESYLGMMRENTQKIIAALQGE